MNKKILFVVLALFLFFPFTSHAATYTREQLEDYVVSTAMSYFYNHTYTDYEGFWEAENHSTYSVQYDIPPEKLSRSKYMNTQCDAFAVSVYMHSLGYDFTNYYADNANGKYTSFVDESGTRQYASSSADTMKLAVNYFSKVHSVDFMNKIARLHSTSPIVIATYQKGKLSTFSSMTSYTKTLTEMSDSEINGIINEMKSLLRPGDIILNNGHSMVYIGNAFEQNGGIIHSSGVSYSTNDDGTVTGGYDDFSVRYSSSDYLFEKQVKHHGSSDNDVVTILRPLNDICNNNTCEINSVSSNAKARSNFKNLRVEQFLYNDTDNVTMSADTSTVSDGDTFSYRLYLTNASHTYFCTSNAYTTEEKCLENGYEWKATSNEENYEGITITVRLPMELSFDGCTNDCVYSGRTVTWENVNLASGSGTSQFNITVHPWVDNVVINFPGMSITYQGETLQMSEIHTTVKRSVVGEYRKQMKKLVDQDVANENLATFSSSEAYVADFYRRFYAKNAYVGSDTFTNLLNSSTIFNAVFSEHTTENSKYYERRSKSDFNSLSDSEKIVSKMVVDHFFGGKLYEQIYHPNDLDYYGYRIKPIWSTARNFNFGDIIVTFKENGDHTFSISNTMIFAGYKDSVPVYLYYQNGHLIKHRILNEGTDSSLRSNKYLLMQMHDADLYVVLRPSQYYKPTITTKVSFTLDEGEWTAETCKSPYTFTESTKTCSKTVEYQADYGSLPEPPAREGYTFKGWYYRRDVDSLYIEIQVVPGYYVESASDFEVTAHWEKNDEGGSPTEPADPVKPAVPIDDTAAHKSLLATILGILFVASGASVVFKVFVQE